MIGSHHFRFIVKKGPNPGNVYPVFAEKITIGRDPMSDIIFKDPEVSRRHVQFTRDSSGYLIEDLGSTNGTFVDGERLAGRQRRLQVGQEIALGGAITLIFETVDSEIDLAALGTASPKMASTHMDMNPSTAVHDDPYAEFRLDDDEFDDEEEMEEDESPHIDQLQSLPSLQNRSSLHTRVLQSADKAKAAPPPTPLANGRTFTNQQIIYLVVGTAVTTVVACGLLLLIYTVATGSSVLN